MPSSNPRIRVSGYSIAVSYPTDIGRIEWRNFSGLGEQFTQANNLLFTSGNFVISGNIQPRLSKLFRTNQFSSFYSLSDLNTTQSQSTSILPSQTQLTLNLDPTQITNYAFFGSFKEFVRVSLENIISNWPASLYVNKHIGSTTGNTIINYSYDNINNITTFQVPIINVINKYGINYLPSGTVIAQHTSLTDLRNFTVNYTDYVISGQTNEFTITSFSASTSYLYLTTNGNPFPSASGGTYSSDYHILPNKLQRETFFNSLNNFENQLMNRLTVPQYTILINFKQKSDSGLVLNLAKTVTWPVSDGYNIDFDSTYYGDYVQTLIDIADSSDSTETDLIARFLVSESITSFDTISTDQAIDITPLANGDQDQKMLKTLRIYGREFDEIKRYTDGLAYAHSFSYDKKNNAPDGVIKIMANTFGWELAQSIVDNDILASYLTANTSSYTGQTVGLTPIQSELEFWRRLIINSPWIWKSKGTRKAIEFLFKIIGTPKGLLGFNEYVYAAESPIDIDLFLRILNAEGLTNFNLDESYIFKLTWENNVEYYHIPVDTLDINILLSSANSVGINMTVSSFDSNLFLYNPTTLTKTLKFRDLMGQNNILLEDSSVLDEMWVDMFGYPKTLPNKSSMYFQKGGLWYRETGGANSTIDILRGNNPHIGPYDRGKAYIDNFETLIKDFTATTVINEIITTGTTNIFLNYNSGTFDNLTDTTIYTDLVDGDNIPTSCITITTSIIDNPFAVDKLTACGCLLASQDDALKIDFNCSRSGGINGDSVAHPNNPTCADFVLGQNVTIDENGTYHFIVHENDIDIDIVAFNEFTQATGLNGAECCARLGGISQSVLNNDGIRVEGCALK